MDKEFKNFGLMCVVIFLCLICGMNLIGFSFLLSDYIKKVYEDDALKGIVISFFILLVNIISVSCFVKKSIARKNDTRA